MQRAWSEELLGRALAQQDRDLVRLACRKLGIEEIGAEPDHHEPRSAGRGAVYESGVADEKTDEALLGPA